MSSNHIVTRRFGAAVVAALMVAVPALGCASDDEDSTTNEAAASTAASGTGTVDEGIDNSRRLRHSSVPGCRTSRRT